MWWFKTYFYALTHLSFKLIHILTHCKHLYIILHAHGLNHLSALKFNLSFSIVSISHVNGFWFYLLILQVPFMWCYSRWFKHCALFIALSFTCWWWCNHFISSIRYSHICSRPFANKLKFKCLKPFKIHPTHFKDPPGGPNNT